MAWLSDLLQGIPLNAVLKERVALAEQKFKDQEGEMNKLKAQVATLAADNEALRKQIKDARIAVPAPKEQPEIMGGGYVFGGDRSKLYCIRCYEIDHRKSFLAPVSSMGFMCTVCDKIIPS